MGRRSLVTFVDVEIVSILAGPNPSEVPETDTRMRVEIHLRMPLKRHDAPLDTR